MTQPWEGIGVAFGVFGGIVAFLAAFLAIFAAIPGMPVKSVLRQLQFLAIFATFPCVPFDYREFARKFEFALGRFDFVDVDGTGNSRRLEIPEPLKDSEFLNGLIFLVLVGFILLCLHGCVHVLRAGTWTRTLVEDFRFGFPNFLLAIGLFTFLPMTQSAVSLVSLRTGVYSSDYGIGDPKDVLSWKVVGILFFFFVSVPYLLFITAVTFMYGPQSGWSKHRPWPLHERDMKTFGFIKRYNVPQGEWINTGIYADYTNRYGSLFEAYKPKYWWWGCLIYWKLFILAIVTGIGATNDDTCMGLLGFLLFVFVVYFVLFVECRPYLGENGIQMFVHFTEVIVVLLVLVYNIDGVQDNGDVIAGIMIVLTNLALILLFFKLLLSLFSNFMAKRRRKLRRELVRKERQEHDLEVEQMKKKFNPWAPHGFEPKISFTDKALQKIEHVRTEPPGVDVWGTAMTNEEIFLPRNRPPQLTNLSANIDTGVHARPPRPPAEYMGGRRDAHNSWE